MRMLSKGAARGLNAGYFLTTSTVTDDGAKDSLVGSSENDWFWAFGTDTTDKVLGEFVN